MTNTSSLTSDQGSVSVSGFYLPVSTLIDKESHQVIQEHKAYSEHFVSEITQAAETFDAPFSANDETTDANELQRLLKGQARAFYETKKYKELLECYDNVNIDIIEIAGIKIEVFTPVEGIAPENEHHLLINLHAGGFTFGFGTDSHEECIPVAALGRIKVMSIDYSLMPIHPYPAANLDVINVYRELIKTYSPENIGIFGCEAGGILTAQTIAWLGHENLPLPAAITLLSAGATCDIKGDSAVVNTAVTGYDTPSYDYYTKASRSDPLVSPLHFDEVLATFPPTLLMTTVRDQALSSVAYTHQQLVRVGVPAYLHVWEGTGVWHFYHPPLAESGEAYSVLVKFFNQHLA